jgi:hypothetical protein
MRRREFIAGTAATTAMGFAQPIWAETNARSTGVKRLAIFYPTEIDETGARKAYFAELKRLGYIEGQNLIVERYAAHGEPDRIRELARQIIASRPDIIWPMSGSFTNEVMAVTTSIPIVAATADPVVFGWTTSLAPWRGLTEISPEWCRMQDFRKSLKSAFNCYWKQRAKRQNLAISRPTTPPRFIKTARTLSELHSEPASRRLLSLSPETLIEQRTNVFTIP